MPSVTTPLVDDSIDTAHKGISTARKAAYLGGGLILIAGGLLTYFLIKKNETESAQPNPSSLAPIVPPPLPLLSGFIALVSQICFNYPHSCVDGFRPGKSSSLEYYDITVRDFQQWSCHDITATPELFFRFATDELFFPSVNGGTGDCNVCDPVYWQNCDTHPNDDATCDKGAPNSCVNIYGIACLQDFVAGLYNASVAACTAFNTNKSSPQSQILYSFELERKSSERPGTVERLTTAVGFFAHAIRATTATITNTLTNSVSKSLSYQP